jgi:hypothetical protein
MSQFEAALCLTPQLTQGAGIANNQIRKKLKSNVAFQFFIARQPDNSHSSSAQNPNERVTAEESLSADKLALRHVRRTAGSLAAHAARIMLEEAAIKPKQRSLPLGQ